MSKRPFSEESDTASSHNDSSKRHHSEASCHQNGIGKVHADNEALLELCENADELIACLQSLKQYHSDFRRLSNQPTQQLLGTKQQLSRLSRKLAPSFERLASSNEDIYGAPGAEVRPLNLRRGFFILKFLQAPHDESRSDSKITSKLPSSNAIQTLVLKTHIPSLLGTPWKAAEIPAGLPPLPKVKDSQVENLAFRHPGIGFGPNYERLEWLGDAYLETIASSLIYQTFPDTPSGRCSQIREQLIRNTTLADYFRKYNMQQRAQLPPGFEHNQLGRGRSADKDLLKTQGDMFEAFVAAVIVSDPEDGLAVAVDWLRALFSTTIREQIEKNERLQHNRQQAQPLNQQPNAKDRLSQLVGCKGILIQYKDMPGTGQKKNKENNLPLYSIGVYFNGWGEKDKLLAVGTALSKKEAGQKAAATVLENRKLMRVYEQKKKDLIEAQQAAQAPAEG